jgi:3-phenylpropionate/cinnamic acid dioxygenase small subunit
MIPGMSEAHEAIARLIYIYAERMDAADFDGIGALFAHAVMTAEGVPEVRRGSAEIKRQYVESARVYPDTGTPKTKHVTTNVIIEVDEASGTATARSYFTVLQQTDVLPLQPIIAGRYHDAFERIDGEWRFTKRHMICDLFGDLSQHLLFNLDALLGSQE